MNMKNSRTVCFAVSFLSLVGSGGCGDPIRGPSTVGPPTFVLRVALPEPLRPELARYQFGVLNDPNPEDNVSSSITATDRSRGPAGRIRHLELDAFPLEPSYDLGSTPGPAGLIVLRIQAHEQLGALSWNDFLVYANGYTKVVFPQGPSGPSMTVRQGYQIVRRTCTPDGIRFQTLPDDTVVALEVEPPNSDPYDHEGPALARCGLSRASEDPGRVLPLGASARDNRALTARTLVISPVDGRLYFTLGLTRGSEATELDVLDPASGQVRLLERGLFYGDLTLSRDGRYLHTQLLDLLAGPSAQAVRIDLMAAPGTPALMPAPLPVGLPSPDGRFLAIADLAGVLLRDTSTGEERPLPFPTPLVWAPDSSALLMSRSQGGGPFDGRSELALVTPAGVVTPRGATPALFEERWLWSAQGPQVVFRVRVGEELLAFTVDTGETKVLLGPESEPQLSTRAELVLPGAAPTMPGPARAFAWTRRCLGLGRTVCTARLHRFDLAGGPATVVATAAHVSPFVVSADGKRLAVAVPGAIQLRDLVP